MGTGQREVATAQSASPRSSRLTPVALAVLAAIAAGLLESAWTGVGRGGPTNTWLGVFALLALFTAVAFPRVWWIPAMAILEEWVHLIAGYGVLVPSSTIVLNHWSHAYVGFPLMPYLTFPLVTAAGEILHWRFKRRGSRREPVGVPDLSRPVRILPGLEPAGTWTHALPLPDSTTGPVNPPTATFSLPEGVGVRPVEVRERDEEREVLREATPGEPVPDDDRTGPDARANRL